MNCCEVKKLGIGEPSPWAEELAGRTVVHHAGNLKVLAIEAGMESGAPSITIRAEILDAAGKDTGVSVLVEMSNNHLQGLAAMVRGWFPQG